jgi:pimeloyl-ACP methyl ester carboxylesterase
MLRSARLMTDVSSLPKLDPNERHFRIPGPCDGLSLFRRFLPAMQTGAEPRRAVLYVHGAAFPSALSVAHRFEGRSWRDALREASFDVWALDFHGFGRSDRYPEMPARRRPCAAVRDRGSWQPRSASSRLAGLPRQSVRCRSGSTA